MDLKEEGGITMDEDGEEDEDEEAEDQELRAAQDQGQDIEMVSGDPKNVQVALAAKGKDPVPPRFCLAREAARETMGQTGGTAGEVPPGWPKFRRELSFPLLVN